jgi:hypothetical protein
MTKSSVDRFISRYIGSITGREHANKFIEISKDMGRDNDGIY